MKNYSVDSTTKNVIEMFRMDAVGRNAEIRRFINLLDSIEDCCSIALNGEWGSGKTFFVKQIKTILDYSNQNSDMDEGIRTAVKAAISTSDYECNECYATVYYDAWANDKAEDPILSLVYTAISNNQVSMKPDNKRSLLSKLTQEVSISLTR